MTTDRGRLLRWLGWFAAANALIAALIGLWYLRYYGWPGSWLGALYMLLAWAGRSNARASAANGVAVELPAADGRRDGSGTPAQRPIGGIGGW